MIGFKLPSGARTLFGHQMDLNAKPWGVNGNLPTPDHRDNDWELFRVLHARRYGPPVSPDDPSVVSFPGLEHPQYQSWIEIIAERNPDFWEEQGLGKATGSATASTEEVFDAQAWEERARIEGEGRRLFLRDRLPDPPGAPTPPSPTPPPPGPSPTPLPPSLPPLSPLSARAEELRTICQGMNKLGAPAAVVFVVVLTGPALWPAVRPLAEEALHLYRLLRRHLGDPRLLPGRE